MSLLEIVDEPECHAYHCVVMIRDALTDVTPGRPPIPALREGMTETVPCGTVARAGNGWLAASAERIAAVRLEAHDAPPAAGPGWDDVLETPYHCATGAVGLSMLTGLGTRDPLRLGPPGTYATRVCVRRAGDDQVVRVQFWPMVDGPPPPPRWLVRSRPAVGHPAWGWYEVLPIVGGTEIRQAVAGAAERHGGSASMDEIAGWFAAQDGPSFLDLPVFPEALGYLTDFIAREGLPTPATMRDLPDLCVAAGLFAADDSGRDRRYRPVEPPPHPRDTLGLSVAQLVGLNVGNDIARYSSFEADLVNTAAWLDGAVTTTVALADLLRADVPDVLNALGRVVSQETVEVRGPVDPAWDPTAPIVVAVFVDD